MTPASLRIRLALALGLPLAPACKSSPSTEPTTSEATAPPAETTPAETTPTEAPAPETANAATFCPPDHVHEHVCGLIDDGYEGGGGQAEAPYEHCTLNALPLSDVDTRHVIDGWRLGSHDPVLATFAFDAPGTAAYEYTGTYQPETPRCCYQRCNPIEALEKPRTSLPAGAKEHELCLPAPESTRFPAAAAKTCPAALRTRHFYPYGNPDPLDDAPFTRAIDDLCCYSVATLHRCPPNTFETKDGGCEQPSPGGRPLREGERIVVAPTHARDGWHAPVAALSACSAAAREHAAAGWAREAAYEHASVAAFARLAIDLMIHGAPAELVDAAHVAARDEIRHAQQCYGIASALGGSIVGPGPLALSAVSTAPTLEELALACFRDGCVNETVAALCVAEASRRAASPTIRESLAAIADDEARHAELSYRILAWALRVGDAALRARVADELAAVRRELASEPTVAPAHPDHDETTGLLTPRTAAQVRRRVLADVVVPCTEALLASAA